MHNTFTETLFLYGLAACCSCLLVLKLLVSPRILALVVLGLALMLSGCATTFTRVYQVSGYADQLGVYPATRLDAALLAYVPEAWQADDRLEVITEAPFILMDLPFSLTFDTLLLPYDLFMYRR